MRVRAFLADGVQSSEGKLYVLGAGWNRLTTQRFPTRHSRLGIGALIVVGAGEAGSHALEVCLLDPTGARATLATDPKGDAQTSISLTFSTREPTDGLDETVVPFALNLDGLVFREPGVFAFELRVDDGEPERLSFAVDLAPPDGGPPPDDPSTTRSSTEAGYL